MIEIFNYCGIVAFAISGALTGIKNKMDWFGVMVLGITCAFGGGLFRDILLHKEIPWMFENWTYLVVALITSLLCLIPKFNKRFDKLNKALLIMDTIGISVFSVVGAKAVIDYGNTLYTIFVGTITAVGGGIICDLFADQKPRIFVSDFYASSCILGIFAMIIFWQVNQQYAVIVGAAVVIATRALAIQKNWGKNPKNK